MSASTRGLSLMLGLLMTTAIFGVDVILPGLPVAAAELDVRSGSAQLATTFALLGFGLGQLPVGFLADRFGRVRIVLGGLLLFGLSGLGAYLAESLPLFLGCRLLQGLGAAAPTLLARVIVRDIALGREAGRILSTMEAILATVTIGAPALGGLLVDVSGWRTAYLSISLYGLAMLLLVWRTLPETEPCRRQLGAPWHQLRSSLSAFLSSPQSLLAGLLFSLSFGGFMAFVTNGASLAIEVYHVSPAGFGVWFAAIAATHLLGALGNRRWIPRFGITGMLRIGAAIVGLAGLALLGLALHPGPPLVLIWLALAINAISFSILMPTCTAAALDPLPNTAGFTLAICGTLQAAVAAVLSGLVAQLYDHSHLGLCAVVGGTGVSLCLLAYLGRSCIVEKAAAIT